jgi:hypothetical protein
MDMATARGIAPAVVLADFCSLGQGPRLAIRWRLRLSEVALLGVDLAGGLR